jgi:HAD superfamily hydrolase (TIGR01490 family)
VPAVPSLPAVPAIGSAEPTVELGDHVVAAVTGHLPDSAQPVIAAFFDVDNTVIRGASSYHLARELYRRKFFGKRDILKFAYTTARYVLRGESKSDINKVRDRALAVIKGHTAAEVTAIGEYVYDAVLKLRIFPGTKKLIDHHLDKGHEVWFVTASPVEIGELIARRLGATGALGTIGEQDHGVYTGKMIGDMMHGKAKADAIRGLAAVANIDLAASYAYSDSLNDLPMMNVVGNPSPINPDSKLRKFARQLGWPVRDFREKRRKYTNRSLRTASVAGGAWLFSLIFRTIKRRIKNRFGR